MLVADENPSLKDFSFWPFKTSLKMKPAATARTITNITIHVLTVMLVRVLRFASAKISTELTRVFFCFCFLCLAVTTFLVVLLFDLSDGRGVLCD